MSRRTILTLLTVILGIALGGLWTRREKHLAAPSEAGAPVGVDPAKGMKDPIRPAVASTVPAASSAAALGGSAEERSTLADGLNAPDGNIQRDFQLLEEILSAWRTNYPRWGNPVGENNEITSALTGGNTLHLALIPKDHPAVNADGELCDRWGTPFRFHQLSGEEMEIRSAGPDRKFGTADDARFTPTGPE